MSFFFQQRQLRENNQSERKKFRTFFLFLKHLSEGMYTERQKENPFYFPQKGNISQREKQEGGGFTLFL